MRKPSLPSGRFCAFGKIPARPDFVVAGMSPATRRIWDGWLQDGMAACQELHGADWKQRFRLAPVWHVALPAQVLGGTSVIGLMLPSMDAVGRDFPLFLGVEVAGPLEPLPLIAGSNRWFAALGALGLDALDPGFDPAELGRRVLPRWQIGILPGARPGTIPLPRGEGVAVELPMVSAMASLAQGLCGDDAGRRCLFWTAGGKGIAPMLAISAALPSGRGFVAMMDGHWQAHGWAHQTPPGPTLNPATAAPRVETGTDPWDREG